MQTKRKFLLSDNSILRALQRAGLKCRKIKIAWFYTSFYPEIYYIRQNDECSLHHKKEDLDRQTLNFKISKDETDGSAILDIEAQNKLYFQKIVVCTFQ